MRASATAAQIALIIVSALPGRWSMSHTTGTVPMRMARPASWRSRNCFRVAARVLRGEALREHHVDASDVEAAAGKEEGEADVEQCERAGGDTRAAEDLQRHAPDKQVAVRKEAAAEVAAEEVQAVVECAEHAHQRGGRFHAELQMLRRVEDQGRVEDGEAERRENLNEEQRGRSLRSRGEKARFHPALLCRSTRRVMSSRACDVNRVVTTRVYAVRVRVS